MGAVQAQDYRGALWAIGLRIARATEASVEAAIADGRIVRTWPMRRTLHLVAAEDVRPMLRHLAARVVGGSAGRYRALGLSEEDFTRAGRALAKALRGGRRLSRPDAYAVLAKAGVSPEGQRGIHLVGHLAQQGLICLGPRAGTQTTFVLLEEWVPAAGSEPGRTEFLAALAQRYFASHGPASVRDFAWWAGLGLRDAQAAMANAGQGLAQETVDGRVLWASGKAGRVVRSGAPLVSLLPPWDEFLVAYKDRSAAVGKNVPADVPPLGVIGRPVIAVDGRVRGAWRRARTGDGLRVEFEWWGRPTEEERGAAARAAARYVSFVGAGAWLS